MTSNSSANNWAALYRLREASAYLGGRNRAVRDAAYILFDLPLNMVRTHTTYGAFRKYVKQTRQGKLNPEDFRHVDHAQLRRMLDLYANFRGPLFMIDWRIVSYGYVIALAYIGYSLYKIQTRKRDNLDWTESLEDRRSRFSDDYEEHVRR